MTLKRSSLYDRNMSTEARNDRDRRVGQTYSIYLHFEERDALDEAAAARGTTVNALIRESIREKLGLPAG
jgi:hypothetical protein